MPCLSRILTPSGVSPAPFTAQSLADVANFEPLHGVYTITNTFNVTQVLKLDAHLTRLEDSARREHIPLMLDRSRLRAALRDLIMDSGFGDVRFRIGVGADAPDHLYLSVEPFKPLSESVYLRGVKCVTTAGTARVNPEAKTNAWVLDRQAIETALPPNTFTAILVGDHGELLEGLSSNFYAIMDDTLFTAGSGVLAGIAQQIVLEVCAGVIPVRMDAPLIVDVPRIQEAFITSASRGIVPVVQLDDHTFGNGTPQQHTRTLRERYLAWVRHHLEEL
jgi:branched-chain amino acid aminotransferase